MIASLLCTLFVVRQSDSITLQSGCERMPVLLKQLSAQAKTAMRCRPAFEDEVVYVSVRDEPLETLKSQIAEVCHAEWRKEDGVQWLTRTATQATLDRKADQKLALAIMKSAIDPKIRATTKGPMSTADENALLDEMTLVNALIGPHSGLSNADRIKQVVKHHEMGIGARAMNRLLARADLASFADQPPWEIRLYAINPNAYQYSLGPKVADTIGSFVAEQNFAIDRVRSMAGGAQQQARFDYGMNVSYLMPIVEPADVYVQGQCQLGERLDLEAMFVDADGYMIEMARRSIPLWPDPDPNKSFPDLAHWGATRLKYSDQALLTIRREGWDPPSADPASAKPAEKDPLGFWFDEPLAQLADKTNRNIVAALPDESLLSAGELADDGKRLQDLCTILSRYESVRESHGTLLIAPLKRGQAYDLRTRRKPLQDLLAVARTRPVSIDEAGTYALTQNDFAGSTSLEDIVLGYNQAHWESLGWVSPGSLVYRELAKLYATLSPTQRTSLAGQGLVYSNLSPSQRDILAFVAYSWTYHDVHRRESNDRKRGYRALDQYPSVCLSNGIPADTLIRMHLSLQRAALVSSADGGRSVQGCDMIGYELSRENTGTFNPGTGHQVIGTSKLTPATITQYEFEIVYTPDLTDDFRLYDARLEAGAPVSWANLPPDWLKSVNKARDTYSQATGASPSSQAKPPPPEPPLPLPPHPLTPSPSCSQVDSLHVQLPWHSLSNHHVG